MINTKAFRNISYGLYLISSCADNAYSGCIVNTFLQVTSDPFQVSVVINKENQTCETILEAEKYTATVLAKETNMELIGTFGFHSSREIDKFKFCTVKTDESGLPYVLEHAIARFSVSVTKTIDVGTHLLFVGAVTESEVLCENDPMTYAYYHQVKKGKTPPKASSYIPADEAMVQRENVSPRKKAWRCSVCGHIEYSDILPEDYTCPICGVGVEFFELVE